MKRYMRQNKINFFESPHPQHFDFFARQHLIYPTMNLGDFHQDQLFNTPIKASSPTQNTLFQVQYQLSSTQQSSDKQKAERFLDSSEPMLDEEGEYLNPAEINHKIDFSREEQEDLLIPLTPQKAPLWNQSSLDKNTTHRKSNHIHSSPTLSDPRLCQRGLKKLAFEAFIFVSSQKKTTYKQVAKKLIGQINEDNEIETEKKGEMNIKRRVYDALNVLIALGLLKRQGNKILGKTAQQKLSLGPNCQVQKLARMETREEEMSEERDTLKRAIRQKQEAISDKRRTLEAMKQKIAAIRALESRNKACTNQKNDKIPLPFVMLCSKEQETQATVKGMEYLNIWREMNQVAMAFPSDKIELLGDLDAVVKIKGQLATDKGERGRRYRRG